MLALVLQTANVRRHAGPLRLISLHACQEDWVLYAQLSIHGPQPCWPSGFIDLHAFRAFLVPMSRGTTDHPPAIKGLSWPNPRGIHVWQMT